jgi:hypothetical protein
MISLDDIHMLPIVIVDDVVCDVVEVGVAVGCRVVGVAVGRTVVGVAVGATTVAVGWLVVGVGVGSVEVDESASVITS